MTIRRNPRPARVRAASADDAGGRPALVDVRTPAEFREKHVHGAVNLPLEGIGLILAVDRILDMFRTATNVWSDSCGAVVIAKSEGEELKV